MPRLAIYLNNKLYRTYDCSKDLILIGRLGGLDVELTRPAVSRKHARIVRDGKVFVIEDLGSTNGLRVNGEKKKYAVLKAEDKIQIEHFTLVFEPREIPEERVRKRSPETPKTDGAEDATKPMEDQAKHDAELTFIDINRFLKE